jgi:hypothetical protein
MNRARGGMRESAQAAYNSVREGQRNKWRVADAGEEVRFSRLPAVAGVDMRVHSGADARWLDWGRRKVDGDANEIRGSGSSTYVPEGTED